ncbi:MAG: glycosyltransferase family 4 protein, partial [Actinomycetota bacterium]|nr:glycosyltransferase family 4 protein [Actinomycetota bacterium]
TRAVLLWESPSSTTSTQGSDDIGVHDNSRMSRVLLVGKGPPDRGGISAFLQRLFDGALAREHELTLLNLTRSGPPAGGRFTASNVTRTLTDARLLRRASRDVDVVHLHTALVPLVTLVRAGILVRAARPRRNRVLLHVHSGLVEIWLHGRVRALLTRLLLRPCRTVVACSEGSRAALSAVLGARVVLVDNGIDTHAFAPGATTEREDPPRVLYAGLISPRKGVPELVRASRLLVDRGVDHELVLAGGTPDEGPEDEREARAEDSPAARWIGAQPHEAMPDLHRSADVFCLPSCWEAMPLSVLEAMASGVPVVATAVGDVPRVVRPGVTGLLVPPRDPEALARALEELLTDSAKRREWGRAARRCVVENHSEAVVVDGLRELYERK